MLLSCSKFQDGASTSHINQFSFFFLSSLTHHNFTSMCLHRDWISHQHVLYLSGLVTFPCSLSSPAAEQCSSPRGDCTMPPLCVPCSPWKKNKCWLWSMCSTDLACNYKCAVAGNWLGFLLKLKIARGGGDAAALNSCDTLKWRNCNSFEASRLVQ